MREDIKDIIAIISILIFAYVLFLIAEGLGV